MINPRRLSAAVNHTPTYPMLDEWLAREPIAFSFDSPGTFDAAVDAVMAALGDAVVLLGFGEALHGGRDILTLRNRLFQRLVEAHGYTAIAIESSFPRARVVDEYVAGRGAYTCEAVQEAGFSHGFGGLDVNRELVEWMRCYNADPSHPVDLHFFGFDSPTEMGSSDSPRRAVRFVLDYLASVDAGDDTDRRERIDRLLGRDADWEDPAALMDPTKSVGLSPAAAQLRIETEDLAEELLVRRPELIAKSDVDRYLEAVQYTRVARHLLNYHATLAGTASDRAIKMLGIRDAAMADNLEYAVARERNRGKVLAFAHNSHLQRGKAQWQMGAALWTWWPAGAHLREVLGSRYAVIGSAVVTSESNGIARPEAGSLEARLAATPGPVRFIPTHSGHGLSAEEIAALPVRSGSQKNSTYFALTSRSFTDFDWLVALDSTSQDVAAPPAIPARRTRHPQPDAFFARQSPLWPA